MTCVTLHSRFTGLSSTNTVPTLAAGAAVRCMAENLSTSRPLLTPHQSMARTRLSVGRFTTNSPLSLIKWWLYRSGRTLMDNIGGWVQIVPVQPTVIRFGLSGLPQLTNTGGSGFSRVDPFHTCRLIAHPP